MENRFGDISNSSLNDASLEDQLLSGLPLGWYLRPRRNLSKTILDLVPMIWILSALACSRSVSEVESSESQEVRYLERSFSCPNSLSK